MIEENNMAEIPPSADTDRQIVSYKGCLVGGAVADALGAPAEFLSPNEIIRKYGAMKDMTGGGVFHWAKGETTDDTDQTLVIVDSLIANGGYNPADIARRLLKWYTDGPKDVGTTTARSLSRLEDGFSWTESGLGSGSSNGSLMRTAPIGLYFRGHPQEIDQAAAEISIITHGDPDCVLACQISSHLVALLSSQYSKEDALEWIRNWFKTSKEKSAKFENILKGAYLKEREGNVFLTLSVALNSFLDANSFEETVIGAVNYGGDTDTQATVAGSFAGAYWGEVFIPERWKIHLNPRGNSELGQLAERIFHLNRKLEGSEK